MDELPEADVSLDDIRAQQRSEALREKDDFEALTNNPGWRRLCAWMEEQVKARTNDIILKPCTGVKDQLEAEFSKGEIATFMLIPQIVQVGLATATDVARSLRDDDSTADSKNTGADDSDDADSDA